MNKLYLGFTLGINAAFRTIIPEPQNRIPITWRTTPYALAACLPFLFMAYLVRRPDTHLIRVLLLPSVICACFGTAYRFVWTIPELNVYNWGQCLIAVIYVGKALEFAFSTEGRHKLSEIKINRNENSHNRDLVDRPSENQHLPPWLYDALEISFELRGVGWDFGKGVHVPVQTRPLLRNLFLRATFRSFFFHFLVLDFLDSTFKMFPGVGTIQGGSIFYASLPPLQRYALSTLIHIITGTAMLSGFQMIYDLVTLISVGLLGSLPSSWPPILDDPWSSDSLHVFWSKRWHQLLRRTFMVYGGYPGKWLFGNFGMVQGVFIASGLYHECALYTMGRGFDHRVTLFFAMQAPLLVCEKLWQKMTGRKVVGPFGRLWVYFNMFILAQPMTDAWHLRGLGGSLVIPPLISPTRLILVPFFKHILHQ